jgi:two-component system, cell cycle response regulator CpdR
MQGIEILVVDDDPEILKLATVFLEREGMAVHCASSGEEAIRFVRENRATLMITDLHMPGMKGIELAVRAREIAPEMPIFMITGDVSGDTLNLAREAGVLKVFSKPLLFLEIMETARGAIVERNTRPGAG